MDENDAYEDYLALTVDKVKLIDQFYSDPVTFLNWAPDALNQHDDATYFTIQAYMNAIRGEKDQEERRRARRLFGEYMYELINNYMEDASARRERGEC